MNIAETLKRCPKGTKLYSLVHGEVTLENVASIEEIDHPIEVLTDSGFHDYFTKDGLLNIYYPKGECLLFPSKEQRDWSKFVVPGQETKIQLKPFDKVLVRDEDNKEWECDIFSRLGDKNTTFICISDWWYQCIPYERNEHLLGTTNNP